ncbi:SDR family oxidoreductase [Azospirillum thermophilum]|uniref:Short-chain dehydrogenase n=1 Tax=Azospirillum thermophilum TaxID=2202148 RepID=A0A2S2D0K9_9PROT|nr:SDR family oxidoreductase [Azospirillum thermophilum]AWK90293.1 short-chain dehydrogenase [Azospirillum thermophilum]
MSSTVLILGAASDIGRAIARRYAETGRPLILAARDPERLEPDAADLRLRYKVPVSLHAFDVLDRDGNAGFLDGLGELPGTVVCTVGLLGRQEEDQHSPAATERIIATNFTGPALVLGLLADRMEAAGGGTIVAVSSVAGDRGRASNYIYGSAKAGLTAFLSGLRNRLAGKGVHVVTVKPGFVRTRMTEGMPLPGLLTADPDEVGRAVVRAEARGKDVIYVRPIWRLVMTVIRLLPEALFKRTRL